VHGHADRHAGCAAARGGRRRRATCDPLPSGAVDFGLAIRRSCAPLVGGCGRPTSITVEVPTTQVAIGATIVYVTVDGRSSNGLHFEVLP
jgi:hypothetical protein